MKAIAKMREFAEATAELVDLSDDEFAAAIKNGPLLLHLLSTVLPKLHRCGWGRSQLCIDLEALQERVRRTQPARH
jgi:hypothetical protein